MSEKNDKENKKDKQPLDESKGTTRITQTTGKPPEEPDGDDNESEDN